MDINSPTYGQIFAWSKNHKKISSCTWECVKWDTTSPECVSETTPTPTEEEKKEKKWCCNNSTGDCYSCTKTGAWSTLAQCEAHCPSGTYKHCRPSLLTGKGSYCKLKTWYIVNPGNECEKDADCQNGGTTPPTTVKYSCNTSTWTCSQDSNGVYSSLATCQSNCKKPPGTLSCPGNDYCYACNKSTYQCYQNKNGPYTSKAMCQKYCKKPTTTPTSSPPTSPPPTLPETEPCMISYFELPARAWVGYPITGRWSASDWCDDCDVDCTPYPECVWKQNNIGLWDEHKFKLSQSGTYTYTLTCYGEGGADKRQETTEVKAINLPWWREIIPVLPGFLRGIWR